MRIDPLFLLSGTGMILVAVSCVLYWARRTRTSMVPFLLGAAAWFASVALKVGFAVAFSRTVLRAMKRALPDRVANPLFWLYTGLLTGIFECGLVLLLTRWSRIRQYDFKQAVAFGTGFGAVEAMLLGLASLGAVVAALALPDKMPRALMQNLSGGAWAIPVPVLERFLAVILHVFACVLIIQGAQQRRAALFWSSFVYKSLIDAVAAWGTLSYGTQTLSHVLVLEAIVAGFALIGWLGLRRLYRSAQAQGSVGPSGSGNAFQPSG